MKGFTQKGLVTCKDNFPLSKRKGKGYFCPDWSDFEEDSSAKATSFKCTFLNIVSSSTTFAALRSDWSGNELARQSEARYAHSAARPSACRYRSS